jgi:hypothetical protein
MSYHWTIIIKQNDFIDVQNSIKRNKEINYISNLLNFSITWNGYSNRYTHKITYNKLKYKYYFYDDKCQIIYHILFNKQKQVQIDKKWKIKKVLLSAWVLVELEI